MPNPDQDRSISRPARVIISYNEITLIPRGVLGESLLARCALNWQNTSLTTRLGSAFRQL